MNSSTQFATAENIALMDELRRRLASGESVEDFVERSTGRRGLTLIKPAKGYRDVPVAGEVMRHPSQAVACGIERAQMLARPAPGFDPLVILTISGTILVNAFLFCLPKKVKKWALQNKSVKTAWLPRELDNSPMFSDFVRNSAGARALEILYTAEALLPKETPFMQRLISWLLGMKLCMGVRNRLNQIAVGVRNDLKEMVLDQGLTEVNVLSIACGGARGLFTGISWFLAEFPNVKVNITLLDASSKSLSMAKEMAIEYGLQNLIVETVLARVLKGNWRAKLASTYNYVEMTGLLDYFEDSNVNGDDAEALIEAVWSILSEGGRFILANIMKFGYCENMALGWLFAWMSMVQRTEKSFKALFHPTKFNAEVTPEPYRRYMVARATKREDWI